MQLKRRKFIQLGSAAGAALTVGSQFGMKAKAAALMELKQTGSASPTGKIRKFHIPVLLVISRTAELPMSKTVESEDWRAIPIILEIVGNSVQKVTPDIYMSMTQPEF